jgi:hypothetical protein
MIWRYFVELDGNIDDVPPLSLLEHLHLTRPYQPLVPHSVLRERSQMVKRRPAPDCCMSRPKFKIQNAFLGKP